MGISYVDPMDYGMGIDSLTLRPRNANAVSVNALRAVQGSGDAQVVEFYLINAETIEDFESAFSFDADASATFGMFGGSASFKYAQNHKFHSYSHFLVVTIQVMNAFKQIDFPKLNPTTNAVSFLNGGHQDDFGKEFGDAFVDGIKQGGVFHAVVEFTTTTDQELREISGAITAGELGMFTAQAQFSSKLSSLTSTKSLKIDSFQQGGTDLDVKIDINGIIERAVNFPGEVKRAAASYFVELKDYNSIDMPSPPNVIKLENAKIVIQRYYKLKITNITDAQ